MPFDGTSPNQTHEDIERLLAARQRIAWRGGWVQRSYATGFAVCAWQAIALNGGRKTAHLARLVARELPWPYRFLVFSSRGQIILFNDRSATTQEMMLDVFDRAITRRQDEIAKEQLLLCPI